MRRSVPARFLAAGAALAFALALAMPAGPASAQVNGLAAVSTLVVTSTAVTGTSSVLALDGKYSNCTLVAADAAGTANVVVLGNANVGQYGPGGSPLANPNFGSGGQVVVNASTLTATNGNVAILPVGAYFTWSGNSGTLTAWLTCSSAAAATGGSAGLPQINQTLNVGSGGATYYATVPDTWANSATIITATTTLLVSGVANQNMYIYEALESSQGTNTGSTSQLIDGTGATCSGSTFIINATPATNGATAASSTILIGGSTTNLGGIIPAAIPYIIKSGATPVNLCVVTVGTTINVQIQTGVAVHAN